MFNVFNLGTQSLLPAIYENGRDAAEAARKLTDETGVKHQPRPVVDATWLSREVQRFETGEYVRLSWVDASFWADNASIHKFHYAHASKLHPHMVAYTEDAAKGAADRQTRVTPGVYLNRFFADILSQSERDALALTQTLLRSSGGELQIARTADDIQEVYENGPESCMSGDVHSFSSHVHPVRVYGDSDLALAYIERSSDDDTRAGTSLHTKYIARALIWPDRMRYGRVYPTPERRYSCADQARNDQTALIAALRAAGYASGSFEGASLKRIDACNGDKLVMPYLDGNYQYVELDDSRTVTIGGSGISCGNTNGYSGGIESEDDEDRPYCENCEETVDEVSEVYTRANRGRSVYWCEHCVSNGTFYCHGTNETYCDDVGSTEVNGRSYTQDYASDNFTFCDHTEEYVSEDCESVIVNDSGGEETWCQSACEADAFRCVVDGLLYALKLCAEGTLGEDGRGDGIGGGRYVGNDPIDPTDTAPYHSTDPRQLDLLVA